MKIYNFLSAIADYCFFDKKPVIDVEFVNDGAVFLRMTLSGWQCGDITDGGMIPKLENSFSAVDVDVSQVVITLASAIHQEGCGTVVGGG